MANCRNRPNWTQTTSYPRLTHESNCADVSMLCMPFYKWRRIRKSAARILLGFAQLSMT